MMTLIGSSGPAVRETATDRREPVLDPIARVSEVLFGVILALTFTSTLSAATAGHGNVRTLLLGAIGCNMAWGLVDAVMFLVSSLTERGRDLVTVRAVQAARSPREAHHLLAAAFSPI